MEKTEYSVSENSDQFATCLESRPTSKNKKNKSKKNNKRRFSDEQISLLESIFESDSKLEPKKKVQLARELGLQPRQVAIWFQNRRARWKSKQLEKEFRKLKAEYDSLASNFDSLKDENQSLHIQVQKLNDLLGKPQDWNSRDNKGLKGNCKDMNWKSEEKCCLQERLGGFDQGRGNTDSCNSTGNINAGDIGEEGHELLNSNTQHHVEAAHKNLIAQCRKRMVKEHRFHAEAVRQIRDLHKLRLGSGQISRKQQKRQRKSAEEMGLWRTLRRRKNWQYLFCMDEYGFSD